MSEANCPEGESVSLHQRESDELVTQVPPSPVLARLIEEVRNEKAEGPNAYNRMHNRHNRSR
jgi:hypothetical protein